MIFYFTFADVFWLLCCFFVLWFFSGNYFKCVLICLGEWLVCSWLILGTSALISFERKKIWWRFQGGYIIGKRTCWLCVAVVARVCPWIIAKVHQPPCNSRWPKNMSELQSFGGSSWQIIFLSLAHIYHGNHEFWKNWYWQILQVPSACQIEWSCFAALGDKKNSPPTGEWRCRVLQDTDWRTLLQGNSGIMKRVCFFFCGANVLLYVVICYYLWLFVFIYICYRKWAT